MMKKEVLAIAHLYQKVLDECDRAGAEYVKQVFTEYVDAIDAYAENKDNLMIEQIDFLKAELCECRETIEEMEIKQFEDE